MYIKNEDLLMYVQMITGKDGNSFSVDDFEKVEELTLNGLDITGDYNNVDFNEIAYFSKLKKIEFVNLFIPSSVYEILHTLEILNSVSFEKCTFESVEGLEILSLDEFSIIDCVMDDNSFIYKMNYLKELSVVNGYVDFGKLNNFHLLKRLNISSSIAINVSEINLPLLEELNIEESNIDNLEFVLKLTSLKKLSLSVDQFESNKQLSLSLMQRNISLWKDNLIDLKFLIEEEG